MPPDKKAMDLRAVLDEPVWNAVSLQALRRKARRVERLKDRAPESSGQQVLFEREDPRRHARDLRQKGGVEGLCEPGVGHGAVDSPGAQGLGGGQGDGDHGTVGEQADVLTPLEGRSRKKAPPLLASSSQTSFLS